jgi:hypothetical protein
METLMDEPIYIVIAILMITVFYTLLKPQKSK